MVGVLLNRGGKNNLMNINVNNLDLGYQQCDELNTLSRTSGENLINNLGSDINNLKVHWKGNDATTHINNLIKVYNALIAVVADAKAITSAAGSAMSAIQEVRRANGGSGSVGSLLPKEAPDSAPISNVDETTEYYCDPSARADYIQLIQICTDFVNFKDQFVSQKDTLMSNWTAGANREQAVSAFNDFESNATNYNTYLTGARDNLEIAVNNIAKLN